MAFNEFLGCEQPAYTRPIAGGLGQVEEVYPASQGGGELRLWGEVEVRQGDEVLFTARNKIVSQGLLHAIIGITRNHATLGGASTYNPTARVFNINDLTRSWIYVGTGTGATTEGMTDLVTPVTTKPDATSTDQDSPVAGTYRLKFIATWNSGSLGAVAVEEIGVYGHLFTTIDSTASTNGRLFARLSTTDSEFTGFTVNTAAPLTIEYRVVATFA